MGNNTNEVHIFYGRKGFLFFLQSGPQSQLQLLCSCLVNNVEILSFEKPYREIEMCSLIRRQDMAANLHYLRGSDKIIYLSIENHQLTFVQTSIIQESSSR
jgi:hypothetical protein